jgi:hypothetical protein
VQTHPPIDAVITWVDGSDPAHRQRLLAYLRASGQAETGAAAPTRFGDCNEIEHCVASLLRHAPWLRTLHIVTDAQVPGFIAGLRGTPLESRVRVVDHREFFGGYEAFLPTFSNRAIECLMWRIPGLAERFLYLNDDFVLLRPVRPEDFFLPEGGLVLRGRWRGDGRVFRRARAAWTALAHRLGRDSRPGNHSAQALSARLAGVCGRYLQAPHVPHPMRVSVLRAFFAAHPALLEHNLQHRLRHVDQYVTTALAAHLELAAGSARVDNQLHNLRLQCDGPGLPAIERRLAAADADAAIAFACVQSLDLAEAPVRERVLAWLTRCTGGLRDVSAPADVSG